MGKTKIPQPQVIKAKLETVIANTWGTVTLSIDTDRILQIRAENSSLNLIILPIYNTEYKVYSINSAGSLTVYQGTVTVRYLYI